MDLISYLLCAPSVVQEGLTAKTAGGRRFTYSHMGLQT